jgi:hypothetical protein
VLPSEPALHVQITIRKTFSLCLFALVAACGDLKAAGVGDGGPPDDAAGAPDAVGSANDATSPSVDAGLTGPGPHGSLPSGYCCTADTECRYRHCVDVGSGNKMCLDECENPEFCTRPGFTFTCPSKAAGGDGLCKAPAGFACLAASTFTRGSKPPGACCNAGVGGTNDGTAGSACEGNQCTSSDDNPLVCTHRCEFAGDCPGGFECAKLGSSKACLPTASPYTCE